jgi:hypothetical protein
MGAAMLARPEPEVPPAAAPAVDNSAIELIQGMMMAQSQALAKFEKKMDDRTSNLESMSMQAAMNGAKQTSQTGASHTQGCHPSSCPCARVCVCSSAGRHPRAVSYRAQERTSSGAECATAGFRRGHLAPGGHGDDSCDNDCKVREEHCHQARGDDGRDDAGSADG